jgi:hypothetical protein
VSEEKPGALNYVNKNKYQIMKATTLKCNTVHTLWLGFKPLIVCFKSTDDDYILGATWAESSF